MRINKIEILGITLLVLFMVFGYSLFVSPHVKALQSIYSQYFSQKALVQQREEKKKILNELEKKNQSLEQDLGILSGKFLEKDEITTFLESLYQLAIDTGNSLDTLRPTDKKDQTTEHIEKNSVQLSLKGKFVTLLEFFNRIQNHQKLITIDDFSIAKTEDRSMLRSSLTITFYALSEEE